MLEDLEGEFEMVGNYPKGCSWDMCYGKKGEEEKVERIKSVEWLERDPVYGDQANAWGLRGIWNERCKDCDAVRPRKGGLIWRSFTAKFIING